MQVSSPKFVASPDALKHVYLPDEDTYLLIDSLDVLEGSPRTILEVGVGSGLVITHALQRHPEACGVGIDINPYALDMARHTAELNGVKDRLVLRLESYDDISSEETFDLILFNPPYVPTQDSTLAELRAQRHIDQALNGGHEGRLVIDDFLTHLPRLLSKTSSPFKSTCILVAIEANNIASLRDKCEKLLGLSVTTIRRKRLQTEHLHTLQITLATADSE